ncbi:MAG: hypothetical protein N4A35_10175 [Flavobacteriales bacterium]|jgi:hypothetical protein|nr:hypothetical protein [Flavobacteriales bacterium]
MRVGNKIRYYRNNELLREVEETNPANMMADFTFYQSGARIYNPKIVDVAYQHGAQYIADVKSYSDYYAGGMLQPNRHGGENYRYNFQGQETDDEIKGKGNSVNYKYRMADVRLNRFFATDPLEAGYPHNSPYAFSENVLINAVELEGLELSYVYAPNSQTIMRPKLDNFLSQEELKFNAKIDKFLATDPTALQLAAEQKKRESEAAYQEFLKKQGTFRPSEHQIQAQVFEENLDNFVPVKATKKLVKGEELGTGDYIDLAASIPVLKWLKLAKIPAKSLKVVRYGSKHVASKKISWKKVLEGTKNGPAKFKSTVDVESITKEAWDNGASVTNGKTWKVYQTTETIGAKSGKETKYMRVELTESTMELHGHPITKSEYDKLTKIKE